MDWTTILVTLIGSVATIITTVITTRGISKRERMHAAKHSILQMISEDKVNVLQGKLPENYQRIMHEFDEYKANGGNSYIHQKIDEYVVWYKGLTLGATGDNQV